VSVEVDLRRCNGCRHLPEPRCVKLCPGDLMVVDKGAGKARIREPRDCWGCMACVKACPMRALEPKLPYVLALYGASLKPRVRQDRIIWTLKDMAGREEVYEIRRRAAMKEVKSL